jgi:hypothetical protein
VCWKSATSQDFVPQNGLLITATDKVVAIEPAHLVVGATETISLVGSKPGQHVRFVNFVKNVETNCNQPNLIPSSSQGQLKQGPSIYQAIINLEATQLGTYQLCISDDGTKFDEEAGILLSILPNMSTYKDVTMNHSNQSNSTKFVHNHTQAQEQLSSQVHHPAKVEEQTSNYWNSALALSNATDKIIQPNQVEPTFNNSKNAIMSNLSHQVPSIKMR